MKVVYAPMAEMPNVCFKCPMFDCYMHGCKLYSHGIPARYDYDAETKPDWCELKEMEINNENGN